jgi:hypothetical protein
MASVLGFRIPHVRWDSTEQERTVMSEVIPMLSALTVFGLVGCYAAAAAGESDPETPAPTQAASLQNTLTTEEREQGFRLLFDGETLEGWRGFRRDDVPAAWVIEDGALHFTDQGEREDRGDIITVEQFGDFEVRLEWKISPGGNSGIFFRVSETTQRTYESGPEMQVLDDAQHPDGGSPKTSAGSNYALHAPDPGNVRPVGEWNEVRILAVGGHVEHWLNGLKVVEYELGSEEWERLVADSKFAEWPDYGRHAVGHLALQDHGDPVWYRNIRVRSIGR